MKNSFRLIVVLLFIVLCANVFGQSKSYSFDVKKSGTGKQAVIFIPGFGCSAAVWDETKARFEKDHTCYALTMPGFAGVPPETDPTFNKWKTQIADFIKASKIEKPIIVGHSMGGALALAIAADYPDLPSKIVVVDALPYLAGLMNPNAKPEANNDCTPIINQMISLSDEQFVQMQTSAIASMIADTGSRDKVVGWNTRSDRKTYGAMYCDFLNTDLRDTVSTIKCPSLILLESNFASFKPAIESQYSKLKNARFEYATKGLHFIMYDDADWYLTQLITFID